MSTTDPGSGAQVVEFVDEDSVWAMLLILVCVVPWDGVQTALAVAASAPAAAIAVTAMVSRLRVI
jgi:hypothetical protein